MPRFEVAKFDPAVGSTMDVGIEDASVPDVTLYMKEIALVSIMTPMGDPFDPYCVWGAPSCFWGLPSTAKSDMVEQAAEAAGLPYATIYPGQHQPEDFSGIFVPTQFGLQLECALDAIRYINPLGRGVVFLDELGEATRAVQGAMLGFIRKRVAAGIRLAPGVRIISAANPPNYSSSGFTLSHPMANRMPHFQVRCPPVDRWAHHVISGGTRDPINTQLLEDVLRQNWRAAFGYSQSMHVGYMKNRRTTLHMEPGINDPQGGYGWPSPRTWELSMRMYATARALEMSSIIQQLVIEGCVGGAAAGDFQVWIKDANLPDPVTVLSGGWTPDPRRLDVAFAVLASTTQFVLGLPQRDVAINSAAGLWRLYKSYIDQNMGDLTVSSAQTLVRKKLGRDDHEILKDASAPILRWMTQNNILRHAKE
jgi:hypothetical protein